MESWPAIAAIIRICGAIYLAYLGIGMLKKWWASQNAGDGVTNAPIQTHQQSGHQLFLAGLLNNLLNPKALLFFSVFIPQFVSPAFGPSSIQIAIFGLLLSALALLYNLFLSFIFGLANGYQFNSKTISRHSEGLLGALFLLLAGRLVTAKTG